MSIIGKHLMALVGGTLFCSGALAGGAYLVHVGPRPLMFAELAERKDPAAVLPPLDMGTAAPRTNVTQSAATEQAEPAPESSSVLDPLPQPSPSEPPIQLDPLPPASQQLPTNSPGALQVTPQMLLKYFNIGTNKDVVVPAQLEFTPPSGGYSAPRSSSATYVSP